MKKTLSWAVTAAIAATCAFGAALPAAAADDTAASAATAASSGSGIDTSLLDPHQKELVDKILASLPADWKERADATAAEFGIAHEFSHHVQYEDNLFDNTTLTGPEATRRTELMADAFGTYFLTHSRGEALNTKRVLDSEKSFYEVGDCYFKSSGHHGTPNQRLAASSWGASVANNAANQGHILPSLKLDELFEAKLPDIVKPDATN
ncbi:hypothetical protein ABZ826_35360 [Streptomyces sp. NPDC047515]|uniref:hypothetical protein n=1 Tax=Streptomyces sp. NPDC047515 TaxID=3155380 RepID=UPI0033F262A7